MATRLVPTNETSTLPRWWEFTDERRIRCPSGHHIPFKQRINETGFIRCSVGLAGAAAAANRGTPSLQGITKIECGLWVFVFAIRGNGVVAAQVTLDEMEEVRELQTPTAMLNYLAILPARS